MLTTTADLISAARESRAPVLAFNVITLEHVEAVADAAAEVGVGVIVQVSENAVRYHRGARPLTAAVLATAETHEARLSLHLDHVEDLELLHSAVDLGASSFMVDASRLPDDENTAVTRKAAEWGHEHGLLVEAELGAVGGKGGAHTPGVRTDPDEAAAFVAATGVDALAVAVGSEHARTQRTSSLDQELIHRLAAAVPVPLVLHGSSGVDEPTLRDAAANGIVKINVGTLLNVAFTSAVREQLAADPSGVDPRRYLAAARAAAAAAAAGTLRALAVPA
ncbi:fructose-bisphosphate aldolase class II [Motilibacter rhizosphaerae]|uniref:Fructose-bisphosphate aldolase class II n=1 Tax=Motilibacter rhizosphaerae TaxID=598652 RepID=A0A4Q7NUK9_9ACTN|nr:class II fructose-bisphosphate aldolase [Motilibacter rhizosphaerae]RZS90906.1 fructose-bisphosphate aldolase class II [Motilibacter rhizosphaerae]